MIAGIFNPYSLFCNLLELGWYVKMHEVQIKQLHFL